MRPAAILLLLFLCACTTQQQAAPSPEQAADQLALAERAWLDAYDDHDRDTMARVLADGFAITFPNGVVHTRDDVIAGLDPEAAGADSGDDGPSHYTTDRTIRVLGTTAILTGIYVNPGGEGAPDTRMRYTDTWMWRDGRWQVVASHLSAADR